MQRLPVHSTDIVSIGYDAQTSRLEIEFKEKRIYQYRDIPADIYDRFMRAESFGQFFFAHINGRYRYDRVGETTATSKVRQPLAFVTGNAVKFQQLQEACLKYDIDVEQLTLPVDEIQSDNAEEIAIKKAKEAYRLAGRSVLVNDSFWNILALRGFPGAYQSSISQWLRPEDILKLMEGKDNREVILTGTAVYYDGHRHKVFARDYRGAVTREVKGKGIGLEAIVIMAGQTEVISAVWSRGGTNIATDDSIWYDFAKWYNMQRRLGKA